MKLIKLTPIAVVTSMMMTNAFANEAVLNDVVVTAASMSTPATIELDPKVPRQPLPAHDGADFLKSIPGFSIMRKAGADGEPNFRGMGGSRVNILADDQNIFGGCGQRMDAPTAYIFPEIYDKVTVVKGPQTVLYPGHGSAATVRFEKEQKTYDKPGYDVHASGLVGSFGRHDEVVDANVGTKGYFANFTGSNSYSDDYKDGSGNAVHSKYHRYNAAATLGLTPDDNKRFEISAARSNGYAAYADRTMDGTQFLRENVAAKSKFKNVSQLIDDLEVQVSRNTVLHTMASGVLRPGSVSGMDVGHETNAARVSATLSLSPSTKAKVGADYSKSTHSGNMSMGSSLTNDAELENYAFFAELTQTLSAKDVLVGGVRGEHWLAYDKAAMNGMSTMNPTKGKSRSDNLLSGFGRYETVLSSVPNTKAYVGLGRSERMPDYWELISNSTGQQFLTLNTEKTNQLDLGVIQKTDASLISASLFYNKIKDYVMVAYSGGSSTGVGNVDATTYGGELSVVQYVMPKWKLGTSVAYTHGTNDTTNQPLAQVAPLEGRISLNYEEGKFTHGGVLRLVTAKDKYDANNGGIAGYDIGKTGGFGIFSLNTTYKRDKRTTFSAGIDNVFDKTYAEFISRAGTSITGYNPATTRVNEPGRTAWLKATIALD